MCSWIGAKREIKIALNNPVFAAILLLFALNGASVNAQTNPKQYFEKDFARAPAIDKNSNPQKLAAPTNVTPSSTSGKTSTSNSVNPSLQADLENKVNRLALIVNSQDAVHLKSMIHHMLNLARSRKIPLGPIYQIGDYRNVTEEIKKNVKALGGEIIPLREPPVAYSVSV